MVKPGVYQNLLTEDLFFVLSERRESIGRQYLTLICHGFKFKPKEKPGWFLWGMDRETFGVMLRSVVYWNMPNILPGHMWIDPKREIGPTGTGTHLTIEEIILRGGELVAVMRDDKGCRVEKELWHLIVHCIYSNTTT